MNRLVEMRGVGVSGVYGTDADFGTIAKCDAVYGVGYSAYRNAASAYGACCGVAPSRDKGYGAHVDRSARSGCDAGATFDARSGSGTDADLGESAGIGAQASYANSGSTNLDFADSDVSHYYPSNNPRYKHRRGNKFAASRGGCINGSGAGNSRIGNGGEGRISCSASVPALKAVMLLCGVVGAVLAISLALHISTDVLGIIPSSAVASDEMEGASGAGGASLINKSPQSTPVGEWRKGSLPYLYQTDRQWADRSYADGEIATYGCGPTCLSMVYVALTGSRDRSPVEMADFSEKNGYIDGGITSWLLMSEGSALLGLRAKEVGADANQIRLELSKGHPIICSVGAGDFTTSGHFIVLAGVADGGNKVEIRDPNSYERSHQEWDLDRIIPQCRNIWAFSV